MDPGAHLSWWSSGCRFSPVWLGLWLWLAAGCAAQRAHLDRALLAEKGSVKRNEGVSEHYAVHCPDVLELAVAGRPELNGPHPVDADGRIELAAIGRLRVEGRTTAEIKGLVAEVAGVGTEHVCLRVAEFNSQEIYLYGQVFGLQRAVAYQGQETVLDLLQRVGGITPGAASNDVSIVRPHIVAGKTPEVFRVNLKAIIAHQNDQTNIRLQPFDEVHVGETRKSCLEKCVPPCLRPLYEAICGLRRALPFAKKWTGLNDDKVTR